MLKHAADLSDSHEYFIVWAGGTNARPWGAKADAYSLFPEFEHAVDGMDLTAALATTATTFVITIGAAESIAANEWVGSTLRAGTNVAPVIGYGVIQAHDAIAVGGLTGNLTVTWTIAPTVTAATSCYIVREGRKWGSYPQVRILTPYQPVEDSSTDATVPFPDPAVTGGRSLTLPAPYSGVTGATAFEDVGVLLPATFFEGIDGYGISDVADSESGPGGPDHAINTVSGPTWTFDNAISDVDLLNGGYVIVDWESSSVPKRSWAPIIDSTATTFVVDTWLGDGDPTVYTNVVRYTAWVPHYNDSPYAYLPGEGYTYPNNDAMPCSGSAIGSAVHNRPRGITGNAYGDNFGAMLVAASRLSAAIGKRVNVVNLGVTDSSLVANNERNGSGFDGTLGWYDHDDHSTWALNDSSSIYARLDKLLRTVLPNALLAEASTKSLRCLGVVFAHGETDALETSARQHYGHALRRFVTATRNLIDTLGFNPYANGAEIPYVQPRIAYLPHAIDGAYAVDADRGGGTVTINADTLNLVNSAIEEVTTSDGFATSVSVDDLPRLSTDVSIYSGVGEAELGSRIGSQLARLADYGLAYGSLALANAQTRIVDICNLALSNIGDAGQITSLEDGSEQAVLCKRFLPESRETLLQMAQWGFALRRRQLVRVQKPEPGLYQNWEYCYVMPADVLNAFSVIGPAVELPSTAFDFEAVSTAAYATTFIANDGSATSKDAATPTFQTLPGGVVLSGGDLLPVLAYTDMKPQPYAVEQSPTGGRYIFTNQESATLQYVAMVVDAEQYSSQFVSALAAHLASALASVTIKGDEGEKVSGRMMQKAAGYVRLAASQDANQKRSIDSTRPFGFTPDHLAHRGTSYDGADGGQTRNLTTYPSGFTIK